MTPRTRAVFIDGDQPMPDLIESFLRTRKNRVPVYRRSRDRVIGFVHSEDISRLVLDGVDRTTIVLNDILQPPIMVPPTKKIDEMFDYFQSRKVQAACVLNEFGGIDGIVTMDDVLNYVFSRPASATTRFSATVDPDTGAMIVPGDMKLLDFNRIGSSQIADARMTTVAGVVLRMLDRLPKEGDTVMVDGVALEVGQMEDNRIATVLATPAAEMANRGTST